MWVATAVVICAGDALVLWHHAAGAEHGYPYWLETSVGAGCAGLLAGVLVSRRPGHPFGRVLVGLTAASLVQLLAGAVTSLATATALPRALTVTSAYLSAAGQSAAVAGLLLVLLVAPSGRLLSRRWMPTIAGAGLTFVLLLLSDVVSDDLGQAVYLKANPLATPGLADLAAVVGAAAGLLAVVLAVAGVAALALRLRRTRDEERQQVKMVVFSGIAAVASIVLLARIEPHLPAGQQVGTVVWALASAAIPAATTAAILRHGLYDIDRVVSRTLSYAVVTATVIGVYVGLVALIETVLGFSSSIAVAASTLAAAAAVQPLRVRVQRAVDRRFDRAAYDARRTADAFAQRIRDEVDVDAVRRDLLATVAVALAPSALTLWAVEA